MPFEITMPQLSDTMTEGTVIKWLKKEGDKIKPGEVVGEIETDKANMDMECGEGGTLAQILIKEGGKVPVGEVIAIVATGKENPADVKKGGSAAPVAKAASVGAGTVPMPTASTATMDRAVSGEIHEADHVGHGTGAASPQVSEDERGRSSTGVARGRWRSPPRFSARQADCGGQGHRVVFNQRQRPRWPDRPERCAFLCSGWCIVRSRGFDADASPFGSERSRSADQNAFGDCRPASQEQAIDSALL